MNRPFIKHLVSSPYGDLPVDKDKLDLPLEADPLKTPYRKYFDTIMHFITQNEFNSIVVAVNENLKRKVVLKETKEIIIRTEKHGALYHPASIEIILEKEKVKFGLNVAVTDAGRNWLLEEFSVLNNLHAKFNLPYLPRAYSFADLDSVSFLLEDWFEGYHEFHIDIDEEGGQRLKLWEFGRGYTYLTPGQSHKIYKQASKILTLYYDLQNFHHIHPWHHAAGDFIVKIEGEVVDVRLTTARRYQPILNLQNDTIHPLFALFYFFLNLSLKMRLDKLDGLGEVVWAEDHCVESTVTGFFEALKSTEEKINYAGLAEEFLDLIKLFSSEDIKISFQPIIDIFSGTADYPVISENLDCHVEKLYAILQNLPLR